MIASRNTKSGKGEKAGGAGMDEVVNEDETETQSQNGWCKWQIHAKVFAVIGKNLWTISGALQYASLTTKPLVCWARQKKTRVEKVKFWEIWLTGGLAKAGRYQKSWVFCTKFWKPLNFLKIYFLLLWCLYLWHQQYKKKCFQVIDLPATIMFQVNWSKLAPLEKSFSHFYQTVKFSTFSVKNYKITFTTYSPKKDNEAIKSSKFTF